MGKIRLSVGGRKKSRRLGAVTVMDAADYTASDLDTKVALIQRLIPLGLMHVQETLEAEVEELAGVRHARKTSGEAGRRHGSNSGSVRLGGQRLPIRVPRVRGDEGEMPLQSYQTLHTGGGAVDDDLLRRVLYGISCGNYERAAATVPGAIGLSGSSVSRSFVQASAAQLRAFQERDLSAEDYVALFLDGKTFAEATMVIALGITMSGEKRLLGFIETDTENATVVSGFLWSLLARGLDIAQGILVIIDGGKGLRAAVRKVFAKRAVVQRCQWHKRDLRRGQLPAAAGPDHVAPTLAAGDGPSHAHGGPASPGASGRGAGRDQSVGGGQSARRSRGDPDAPSSGRFRHVGALVQNDQLSGEHQRLGRGAVRQGRLLEELEPASPLAGHGPAGYRTAFADGGGIPPSARTAGGVTA
jgi:putative transposase